MLLDVVPGAINSWLFYTVAILSFLIYLAVLRSQLRGFFDPLVPTLLTHSISAGLVAYMLSAGILRLDQAAMYFLLMLCLIAGFLLFRFRYTPPLPLSNVIPDCGAFLAVGIGSCLATLTVMWLQYRSGLLPILFADPVTARFLIASQNRVLSLVAHGSHQAAIISTLLALFTANTLRNRVVAGLLLAIALAGAATEGSKAALLIACFALGALAIRDLGNKLRKSRYLLTGAILLCSFVYLSLILATNTASASTKVADVLTQRVVLAGDTYIYLFAYDGLSKLSAQFNLITYAIHQFTSPFGLKLVPYNIGTALYGSATGDFRGFGPNPHHVGEGLLLAGPWLAPFYSALVGYLTMIMRHGRSSSLPTAFNVLIASVLAFNAGTASIDMALTLFDTSGAVAIIFLSYATYRCGLFLRERRSLRSDFYMRPQFVGRNV